MELSQELRESLKRSVVKFSYEKTNGELREAYGTRNPHNIEQTNGELPKGTGHEKEGVVAYWDLKSNGWRSCREDKIVSIDEVMTLEQYNSEQSCKSQEK